MASTAPTQRSSRSKQAGYFCPPLVSVTDELDTSTCIGEDHCVDLFRVPIEPQTANLGHQIEKTSDTA